MKQGVLTNLRVRLLMSPGDQGFRGHGRRDGGSAALLLSPCANRAIPWLGMAFTWLHARKHARTHTHTHGHHGSSISMRPMQAVYCS